MPEVTFAIEDVVVDADAAVPQLLLSLRVEASGAETIHSIALRCQVRIEATRRRYSPAEQERLVDLFGEPDRWTRTLGALQWTHVNVTVPAFERQTTVQVPLACTFDFNVASTKYFYGLAEGEIPLLLLFSGTIFYPAADGHLQVSQISWEREAQYRLPVRVWREMMDAYYPNSAWLRLRRDVFDRLQDYKAARGIPTWEAALESLLAEREAQVPS